MREQRVVLEPFGLSEILQCSGVVCANQHGFMMVKGYMKKEKEGEYLKLLGSSVWASVMVYDEWGKAGVLFTGVVTDGEISVENGLKTLKVKIKTGSFLMDLETHIRTFQSIRNMDILWRRGTEKVSTDFCVSIRKQTGSLQSVLQIYVTQLFIQTILALVKNCILADPWVQTEAA